LLTSRRELVRGGVAVALAGSALVCVPAAGAAAPPPTDADLLEATLHVEQMVVISYRRALGTHALGGRAGREVRRLFAHELAHVHVLGRQLSARGGTVPPPPTLAAAQAELNRQHVTASLLHLPDQHACLRLLIEVETVAEAAYFTAISQLQDAALVREFAAALACEAQHWALLSSVQHGGNVDDAVPYPFVRGSAGY
jgi:Ferritin-like domain